MPTGFGFSVGDIIAVINILCTVANALRHNGEFSTQCHQVIEQLRILHSALLSAERLEIDESQIDQRNDLR